MKTEQWKEVPDTDGKYIISDSGKIARVLRPSGRYKYADLYVKGRQTRKLLHRLILEVFMGKPPTEKHQGNHKDGDPSNNALSNLEWVTPGENLLHSYRVLGRHRPWIMGANIGKFGSDNPTSKQYIVTQPDGKELVILGLNAFCKEKGLDIGTMSNIARGRYGAKTHKGWKCRYA